MPTRFERLRPLGARKDVSMLLESSVNDASLESEAHDLACEVLYRYLAGLLRDPRSGDWNTLVCGTSHLIAREAADLLRADYAAREIPLGYGELPVEDLNLRMLEVELERSRGTAPTEFSRVFGLVQCRECPPYETEFQPNEDTFFRSQQMADVAGFYQAFGIRPGAGQHVRPDHLSLELEFAAYLLLRERQARLDAEEPVARATICRDARAAFVRDHLAWWVPAFSLALRRKAERGIYEAAGRLLAAFLPMERARLGIKPFPLPILSIVSDQEPSECEGCGAGGLR